MLPTFRSSKIHTDQEWELIRKTFTELYLNQGKSLAETTRILARDFNFHATVSMFKKRIKNWKLDQKYNKERELFHVVRKTQRAEQAGKRIDIKIRGKSVTKDHALHHFKRKSLIDLDTIAARCPASPTPSMWSCRTINSDREATSPAVSTEQIPPQLSSPSPYKELEAILNATSNFCYATSGQWAQMRSVKAYYDIRGAYDRASVLMQTGYDNQAAEAYGKLADEMTLVLISQSPLCLVVLYDLLSDNIASNGVVRVAALSFLARKAEEEFSHFHPMTQIVECVLLEDKIDLELLERGVRLVSDILVRSAGLLNPFSQLLTDRYLSILLRTEGYSRALNLAREHYNFYNEYGEDHFYLCAMMHLRIAEVQAAMLDFSASNLIIRQCPNVVTFLQDREEQNSLLTACHSAMMKSLSYDTSCFEKVFELIQRSYQKILHLNCPKELHRTTDMATCNICPRLMSDFLDQRHFVQSVLGDSLPDQSDDMIENFLLVDQVVGLLNTQRQPASSTSGLRLARFCTFKASSIKVSC